MSEQAPSIGIDFGTTNSSMAWYDSRTETAEIILNSEGQAKTPSLVYFGETETLIGEPVDNLLEDVSTDRAQREEVFRRTIKSIKRNLISPPRIALPGGRFIRPVDVSAEILKKLKRDAEEGHFHEEVLRAVITCPAEFNVLQRRKIEEAGHLAGFDEVVLLEEPVAGALAYARAGLKVGKHVLVYDLGGGTFDLAVLDNEGESFHVAMEPKGIERCGGDDFDSALYHHCDELARQNLGRPISLTGSIDLNFLRECRRRKEILSYQERGRFSNYLASENGPVRFEHEVDRQTFEELISEYVETTTRLTEEIIQQADTAGHEVDTVVLVGGSTRVRLVVRMLNETLPVNPLTFDKKDVAIALGAAHYANIRWTRKPQKTIPRSVAPVADQEHYNQYLAAVEETFSDGKLSKVELDRLNAFARQLGLSREQTVEIERQVMGNSKEGILFQQYRGAIEMVWMDQTLNELEVEWLDALAAELGLKQQQISYAESKIMGATKEEVLTRQRLDPKRPGTLADFALTHTLTGHMDEVHSVAFSPDGEHLASGASDNSVRGWSARTGLSVGKLAGHMGRVNSVTFSPDRRLLASGGFDKTIRVWKLPNGEPFHTLNHLEWVFSLTFSPDNKTLISGGADKEIKLWSLQNGQLLRTLAGHSHWILSIAISPDGRYLISGSADSSVKVWNLETGEPLYSFEHPGWVWSVAVDPEGRLVASGSGDGGVRIWDLKTGHLVHTIAGHAGAVLSVAMSPNGPLLYSGGSDGKVKILDPRSGEALQVLSAHPGGVSSIAVSPDGTLLASGGDDQKIKLWKKEEIEQGKASPFEAEPETLPSSREPRIERPGRPQDLPD